MAKKHRIGLVVPYAEDKVPPEGLAMYPDIEFVPRGTGVTSLTPEGYDAAVGKIIPGAEYLAGQGVEAVMLMGTSLTFYKGRDFHDRLLEQAKRVTGLPCSTMSEAVVDGLRTMGARRIAIGTAYSKVVNDALSGFLQENGIETLSLESFGITTFGGGAEAKSDADIVALGAKAIEQADDAEGLLISCGGLRTLTVAPPIEARFGLPVVTSTQSSFLKALQLVGESGRLEGYGRMLGEAKAPEAARA